MKGFGFWIGWMGVAFGLLVAPAQLYKILKSGGVGVKDISIWTYIFLVLAMVCYLIHAIIIKDAVFIVAQSVGLMVNSIILYLLIRRR